MAAEFELHELLRLHPKLWWDPVPWWYLEHIDKGILRDIAVVQIETQRAVLDAQMKGLDRTLSALRGGR